MEKKKFDGVILNVLRYEDKKSGGQKLRISYFLNSKDAYQDRDNFVGFSDLSIFTSNVALFDKLRSKISKPIMLVFEEKSSISNPLKTYLDLVDVEDVLK